MKILIQRESPGEKDTLGSVSIDGAFFCFNLEPARHEKKITGHTRIPAGTYKLESRWSPLLGRKAPWVKDVPGFEYILIHNGNTHADTRGCILLGNKIGNILGDRAVLNSMPTCKKFEKLFFPALEKGEVTITILDEIQI